MDGHDREVRHLGVVAVRPVERVGLARADVDGERLAVIRRVGVVCPSVALDELGQERVGARGVVRRVGQPQDVLVVGLREVGPLPELGELLLQLGAEVLAARLVRLEGQAEALHLRGVLCPGGLRQQAGGRIPLGSHGIPPVRSTVPPPEDATPASVSTYRWLGELGLAGFVMRTIPASRSGCRCFRRKYARFFAPARAKRSARVRGTSHASRMRRWCSVRERVTWPVGNFARGRDLVTGLVVRGLIVAEMSSEGVAVRADGLNQRLASQLVGDRERSGAGEGQ